MVLVIVGVGRWVADLFFELFFWFSSFFTSSFFFFLDVGVDLVTQWEARGWVDTGGCLMMVAMGVVLRDDSVKRNDYFIE